jgi:hypothetical protein
MNLYSILLILVLSSCKGGGSDCQKLPLSFNSFDEAERQIKNSHFNLKNELNTKKSSWIRGAKYFSCDKQTGFFILETDKQDYLYQNLPLEVWTGFKNASSFGQYYNANIKNRYQYQLTKNK